MKFRLNAAIAIYVLFTLLFTHASDKKEELIKLNNSLIPANQHNLISLMIKYIRFLEKNCKDVSIDKNMIIHFKYEEVKYWFNLNYFLDQSYRTVFNIGVWRMPLTKSERIRRSKEAWALPVKIGWRGVSNKPGLYLLTDLGYEDVFQPDVKWKIVEPHASDKKKEQRLARVGYTYLKLDGTLGFVGPVYAQIDKKDLIRSRLIPANQHNFISLIKNIIFLRKKCKDVSIDKNMIIHFKYEEVKYWFNLNYFLLQSYRTVFNIGEADQNYAILPRNNAFIDRIVAIMNFKVKMIFFEPPRKKFYQQITTHIYRKDDFAPGSAPQWRFGPLHTVYVNPETNEHYESEPPNWGNSQ